MLDKEELLNEIKFSILDKSNNLYIDELKKILIFDQGIMNKHRGKYINVTSLFNYLDSGEIEMSEHYSKWLFGNFRNPFKKSNPFIKFEFTVEDRQIIISIINFLEEEFKKLQK